MLGIKIRDTFISLFADTQLTFEMSQPMGLVVDASEIISSGYSFPIQIPLDDINRQIVGHADRLDLDTVLMADEYCEVWIEGLPLHIGKATIRSATESSAELYMVFNDIKPLTDVALSDVDLGGDRTIGTDTASRLAHALDTANNPQDYDYVFCPVLNPVYGIDPSGLNTSIVASHLQNDYDTTAGEFVESLAGHSMPFIRVDYLLRRIFAHLGYTLDNQWQITDELRQLILYNNRSIYSDNNSWDNVINLTNHVPYTSALDFVKAIINTFALSITMDTQDRTITLMSWKSIIQSAVYEDITHLAERTYGHDAERKYISIFRYDIDVDDQLSVQYSGIAFPQATVLGSLLTVHSIYFGGYGTYYIRADNAYYLMESGSTTYVSQDQKRVTKDGSSLDYISPLIPMWSSWDLQLDGYIDDDDSIDYQQWLIPHIRHAGYALPYSWMRKPQMSIRTMFYRGMQPYDTGIDGVYPMAGVTRYNIRGEEVGAYALTWDQDGGVYDAWWKLPFEMLQSRKNVVRRIRWSIADLIKFRWYQKYRIENQNYFINRYRYTATMRGISPVECTMMTTL